MFTEIHEGLIPLTEAGDYDINIQAWPDHFATWQSDTHKKKEAGQDIALELQEGRDLLARLFDGAKGEAKKIYTALSKNLGESPDYDALIDPALDEQVARHGRRDGAISVVRPLMVERKRAEFSAWYELFPRSQGHDPTRSGTFKDCIARLPDIAAMGFDVLYFTPIHPIGKTHRKGRNNSLKAEAHDPGSPYAIGSSEGGHKAIHPELGTLEDFRELVTAAKEHGLEVALDFAIQCSPDHPYIKEHPEWFSFRPDGSIKYAENPPKKYQDIVNVNFESADAEALWIELRSIVEFWVEQGVTIFRVDNPHTKPFAFWEWLIAGIRKKNPEIIFLSEAFTRPKIMYRLAKLGFSQSYSYFTWRNTKEEFITYLTELTTQAPKDFFRPNFFPVTPDIFPPYLHGGERAAYMVRLALAATLGSNYGMLAGYELLEGGALPGKEEYADSEKFEVKPRDWNAPGNIKPFVTQLNTIRRDNPALQQFRNLAFHPVDNPQLLFYSKWSDDHRNHVFVVVNLDAKQPQEGIITLPLEQLGVATHAPYRLTNLLEHHEWQWQGARQHQRLDPAVNPVAIFRVER